MYQRSAVYALLSVLYCAPLLAHFHDCVFGVHDWGYPCYAQQGPGFVASLLAPLSADGLGGPNPRATNNPIVFLAFGLAAVWPGLTLRLFLLLTMACAGIAADLAAARVFGIRSNAARLVAGIMYMAAPFFATKLTSGHLYFFLSAVLVPLALVAFSAIPTAGRHAWAACAACIAGSLAQLQVGAALILVLAIMSSRRVLLAWAAAVAVALLTFMPTIYAATSAYALGALSTETQLLEWVRQNSIPLGHVLDGTWYFAQYYTAQAGGWTVHLWQAVALACVLVAALRGGTPRRLALAVVVLGIIASGTRGPLSAVLTWTFVHLPSASVFRELYDLLAIAPLVVAGGAGIALEWLLLQHWSVPLKIAALGASGLACIGCLWPAATGAAARTLPFVSPDQWSALVGAVDGSPGSARALWLPDEIPVGPSGTAGGADPFFNAIGTHASANAYHPQGILAYASALADRNGFLPEQLARRLGIGSVIVRPGLESTKLQSAAFPFHQVIVPPNHPAETIASAEPVALVESGTLCQPPLRSQMLGDAVYAPCQPSGSVQSPVESLDNLDDPRREWVSGERWAALDVRLAEPRWPVLFSLSAQPYEWRTDGSGFVWVYTRGAAELDGKRIPAGHWSQQAVGAGDHRLSGDGTTIVAISASTSTPDVIPVAGKPATQKAVALLRVDRAFGRYDARVPPHMDASLVLRERWSPFWVARVDGADLGVPWRANDYAAAWSLPASNATSTLEIRYTASSWYAALVAVSWLIWIVLAAIALVPRRTMNRTS